MNFTYEHSSLEMNFTYEHSISPNLVSNVTVNMSASLNIYYLAFSFNAIFGLPINSYVLWLICTGKGSGILAEFFSLNLTVCEIIFCLITLLFMIAPNVTAVTYITCFSVSLPTTGRPLINCVICIERYLAVLHPVTFLKYKPLRYRLACSVVIWLMVFGFGGVCAVFLFSHNLYMYISLYLPLYLVLLSTKLVCCLIIVRALKYPGPGEKDRKRTEANQMKKKAIAAILTLTGAMAVQYILMIFIGLLSGTLPEAEVLMSTGVVFFLMFGYVSPFFYICKVRNL